MLAKCVLTILELNWNQRLGHKKIKLNICHHLLTSSTQLQNRSFNFVERTRTSSKCQKMKIARAKRAKILFFTVKYANLWGFCCRRRRGCLCSLIIIFQELLLKSYQDEAIAKNATYGSFWCSLLHDYSLLAIPSTCFRRLTLEIVTNRVSSSQPLSGGLFDLTNQTSEINKINWAFLSKSIRLYYQILDHLCLNEQLKYIETWLRKKNALSFVHIPFHGYFINWVTKDRTGDIHSSAYCFLFDFGVFWIFKRRNEICLLYTSPSPRDA